MATDREFIERYQGMVDRDKGHLVHRVFRASKGCKKFKTIVIRELDGIDEQVVSRRVSEKLRKMKDPGVGDMMKLEHFEQWRISIAAVDGVQPPNAIAGFVEFDKWPKPDQTAVGRFWGELNGLDTDDLEKSVTESEEVDPTRLTESANALKKPSSASPGAPTVAP